jgi:rod shape-determining protein MreD
VISSANALWVVAGSLIVALVLHAVPLPFDWRWYRPELPLLVLFYWVLALPHRIGVFSAAITGFAVDLLEGDLVGGLAVGAVVATLIILFTYQRIRQFNLIQQGAILGMLLALALLVESWLHSFLGLPAQGYKLWLAAAVAIPMWPVVRKVLRGLRRYFEVS